MGKLYDDFANLSFRNEAEVSQNFLLPLLQGYLGYDLREIVPEMYFPAKDLYSGVNYSPGGSKGLKHKPDYVICINGDTSMARFIIDSKAPTESIDDNLGQLRSYANSVGKNFVMMTNGKELKVFDVNNLIFHTTDIAELQIKIEHLVTILGKNNQTLKSEIEILREFDYENAISNNSSKADLAIRQKQILLADFDTYLRKIAQDFEFWHLPTSQFHAINNLELRKLDPNLHLSFRLYALPDDRSPELKILKLFNIEQDYDIRVKILIGETGTGKTSLLKFLCRKKAQQCILMKESQIPVFISLRDIGPGYTLEGLILASLNRYGYATPDFYSLPISNDFIFLLDAFDEVPDDYSDVTSAAIERLGKNHECIITSRPNAVPHISPSVTFDVLPLSDDQVETITRKYLGDQFYEFKRQIDFYGLRAESQNTLLLLFLISLFKDSANFPPSASGIIRAIVNRVKSWQNNKSTKNQALGFNVVEIFISDIAYVVFERGDVGALKSDLESNIASRINELEGKRIIKSGYTISEVFSQLSATGLIIETPDRIYFWHRLFLNYFASVGLKEKFEQSHAAISAVKGKEGWDIVIIGMASILNSVTTLISLIEQNVLLAAYCLTENSKCEEVVALQTITNIIELLNSPIPDTRINALFVLSKIDHPAALEFIFVILEKGEYYDDILMRALPIVAASKSERAKNLIQKYSNHFDSSFFTGDSWPANLARALYCFGENEHLQILENWANTNDYFLDIECKQIFFDLHAQNKLTPGLRKRLKILFRKELHNTESGIERIDSIGKVLALDQDDELAVEILNGTYGNDDLSKLDGVSQILKANKSIEVARLIKNKISQNADEFFVIERLSEVLSQSAADVPKEFYIELIAHPNSNVASRAIGSLKRFDFHEVEHIILPYLHGQQPQLQSWALEIFIENGEIVSLIRSHQFPKYFYNATAHVLFKAARRYRLIEALSIMDNVKDAIMHPSRSLSDLHLALDLAGTYFYLGQEQQQADIIARYFENGQFLQHDKHIHNNIMKRLKYFNPTLAGEIANSYFHKYFPFERDKHRYELTIFTETAEELAQCQLKNHIKTVAELLLNKFKKGDKQSGFDLERPIRAMVHLASPEDEAWMLELISDLNFDPGLEFPQLRRAIECLAYIGTKNSIPAISKVAKQRAYSILVLNTCFRAYTQICRREKIPLATKEPFWTNY